MNKLNKNLETDEIVNKIITRITFERGLPVLIFLKKKKLFY